LPYRRDSHRRRAPQRATPPRSRRGSRDVPTQPAVSNSGPDPQSSIPAGPPPTRRHCSTSPISTTGTTTEPSRRKTFRTATTQGSLIGPILSALPRPRGEAAPLIALSLAPTTNNFVSDTNTDPENEP
jgi:hypothetical protein